MRTDPLRPPTISLQGSWFIRKQPHHVLRGSRHDGRWLFVVQLFRINGGYGVIQHGWHIVYHYLDSNRSTFQHTIDLIIPFTTITPLTPWWTILSSAGSTHYLTNCLQYHLHFVLDLFYRLETSHSAKTSLKMSQPQPTQSLEVNASRRTATTEYVAGSILDLDDCMAKSNIIYCRHTLFETHTERSSIRVTQSAPTVLQSHHPMDGDTVTSTYFFPRLRHMLATTDLFYLRTGSDTVDVPIITRPLSLPATSSSTSEPRGYLAQVLETWLNNLEEPHPHCQSGVYERASSVPLSPTVAALCDDCVAEKITNDVDSLMEADINTRPILDEDHDHYHHPGLYDFTWGSPAAQAGHTNQVQIQTLSRASTSSTTNTA